MFASPKSVLVATTDGSGEDGLIGYRPRLLTCLALGLDSPWRPVNIDENAILEPKRFTAPRGRAFCRKPQSYVEPN
jgi:hypothetical protein